MGGQFVGGQRFELVSLLGEGGMGRVYRARDHDSGRFVALKAMTRVGPVHLARLKREFRALIDLVHPNLVELYELVVEKDQAFFTMELVEGSTLARQDLQAAEPDRAETLTERSGDDSPAALAPSRARPVPGEAETRRVKAAVAQLAAAVAHLHAAGKLHRDLKPSNVMLTPQGRVVLLDFGLAADPASVPASERRSGTRAYMAPELLQAAAVTSATDCYALGVLLYELLTGRLPRAGHEDPRQLNPFVGDAAGLLTLSLLSADPLRRPAAIEVAGSLDPALRSAGEVSLAPFGRDPEQRELHRRLELARAGSTQVMRLRGASGMGKTLLLDWICGAAARGGALALRSRCLEQESLPYKAFDGVMDGVARVLAELPAGTAGSLVPGQCALAARLFPVLRRLPFIATQSSAEVDTAARPAAFEAVAGLLRALSTRAPLLVCVDDAQWGDPDSAALLRALVRPRTGRILFLFAHRRDDRGEAPLVTAIERAMAEFGAGEIGELEVGPLPREEAEALAKALLGGANAERAAEVARESAGSPYLIGQLARHLPISAAGSVSLAGLVARRKEQLDACERKLLELVALATGPLDRATLLEAAGLQPGARYEVQRLSRLSLLRTSGSQSRALVEPFHDQIREAVAGGMSSEEARARHLSLAGALRRSSADPEILALHYAGAAQPRPAAYFGLLAARRAKRALAFDRHSANLQAAMARVDRNWNWRSHRRLAHALSAAGRGAEAAAAFETAARLAPGVQVLALRRLGGESHLRSGRIAAGQAALSDVLRIVGVSAPRGRMAEIAKALFWRSRLLLRGLRPGSHRCTPRDLEKLDALWSTSTSLSMVNHLLADGLGVQSLVLALDAGDPARLSRSLGYEAAFESILGGRFFATRVRRLLAQMDSILASQGTLYDQGWGDLAHGIAAWFRSDWKLSLSRCDSAMMVFADPRCGATTWERAIASAYSLPALASLGRLRELRDRCLSTLRDAEARGDLFAENTCRLGQQSLVWLMEDRPEQALSHAAAAIAPFPAGPYLIPHYHYLTARAQAELYRGRPQDALAMIRTDWPLLRGALLLVAQCVRTELRDLRGRSALATALASGGRQRGALLSEAQRMARLCARDSTPMAAGMAAALRAGIARASGDQRGAGSGLEQAREAFAHAGMRLHEMAAAWALGNRDADEWARGESVLRPDKLFALLVPAGAAQFKGIR